MNDNGHSHPKQVLIWWVIWAAFLLGVLQIYFVVETCGFLGGEDFIQLPRSGAVHSQRHDSLDCSAENAAAAIGARRFHHWNCDRGIELFSRAVSFSRAQAETFRIEYLGDYPVRAVFRSEIFCLKTVYFSGNSIQKALPFSGSDSKPTSPPMRSAAFLTIARPMPVPE